MNSLRQRTEQVWNTVFGVAILVILVSGWLLFQGRTKGSATPTFAERDQIREMEKTISKAKGVTMDARSLVSDAQWHEDSETLGSTVLESLTEMVDKRGLQLSGFRTGKAVSTAGMREAPFMATVEGSYSDLVTLIRGLEDPKARLTLNMLEVKSSDRGSGDVVATLGLVAFVPEGKL